jgi:hypothetical protein
MGGRRISPEVLVKCGLHKTIAQSSAWNVYEREIRLTSFPGSDRSTWSPLEGTIPPELPLAVGGLPGWGVGK